jgi:uncharacterized protein
MQHAVMPKGTEHLDLSRIAQDLQIRKVQVESVVGLLDEGNTVPFITRYRKERTGGLNEDVIRQVQTRVGMLRQLAERKETILKSIEGQGKLTDALRAAILAADTSKRLEDLYLPYKPKKRTLATVAREKGLEPLAQAIWRRDPAVANLQEILPTLVNPEKELKTPEDVLQGVQHILAEQVAETADVRAAVRTVLWETGKICSVKSEKLAEMQGLEYKDYFKFEESVRQIPPHRILALNRGEKENALKIHLEWNTEAVQYYALRALAESAERELAAPPADDKVIEGTSEQPVTPSPDHLITLSSAEPLSPDAPFRTPHAAFLKTVVADALARLLLPSLEREIRRELTEEAEGHAVAVFARNLRSLLLQPPLHQRRVLAIDPGFRTGCKVAALDETGTLLEDAVIYPHQLHGKKEKERPQPGAPAPPPPPASPPLGQSAETIPQPVEQPQPVAAAPEPAPALAPLGQSVETMPQPEAMPQMVPAPAEAPPPPTPMPATVPVPAESKDGPTQAPNKRAEAKAKLEELIRKHNLNVIAIGNGTACRETEEVVSELIAEKLPDLAYVIVNEAGASVYSASAIGKEEFPNFDATLRGTISIGRRLQDPLSELVKVDPQSIGVGLYQHDVNPRHLKESLEGVVESCVNQVGVDLNTASVPLLRHVSGLNQMVARDLVDYRKQHGAFKSREQILQVPGIGPARYVQAAGFLKIIGGDNPFDRTWIHPESYPAAQRLLSDLGYGPDVLEGKVRRDELQSRFKALSPEELATRLEVGVPTLRDIFDSLARPGRDPREDLPPPIFKKGILKLEDLQPGMELKGTVLNVVDFGAFVDIGLKDSGLVHISQMANRYIKSPYDVVAVSDVVTVWVLTVDQERRRVSLTMIKPGTERKAPESRAPGGRSQPRPQQQQRSEGGGPPRGGRRPPPRPQGQGQPGRAPRPRGGRHRAPPVQAGATPQTAEQAGTGAVQEGVAAEVRPVQPPPPPRKPRREAPKPKLTKDALEGRAPLRTFGELGAYFSAKQQAERQVAAEPAEEKKPENGPPVPQQ